MTSRVKFSGTDLDSSIEFTYPNIWQREEYSGGSRLLIGAREREIALILDLCREFDGPFGILYVLLASRLGYDDARYQNPEPIDYDELELFLWTFQLFLEQDGRHHRWVISLSGEGQFIFDRHNIIFAYGNLERYESYLMTAGFRRGSVEVQVPHAHNFHAEYDSSEDELMKYWEWKKFPLQADDNP